MKMKQVERHPKKKAHVIAKGDQIFYNGSWRKVTERRVIVGMRVELWFTVGYAAFNWEDNLYVFDSSIVFGDMAGILFLAFFALPASIIWGIVISKAWEWFVVPVFNINQMPVVLAAVIVLCFRGLFPLKKNEGEMVPDVVKRAIMTVIVGPGLTFLYLLFLSRFA